VPKRARRAGCDPAVEQTIWRAATYTREDIDAALSNNAAKDMLGEM